jgi:hypothetical protein
MAKPYRNQNNLGSVIPVSPKDEHCPGYCSWKFPQVRWWISFVIWLHTCEYWPFKNCVLKEEEAGGRREARLGQWYRHVTGTLSVGNAKDLVSAFVVWREKVSRSSWKWDPVRYIAYSLFNISLFFPCAMHPLELHLEDNDIKCQYISILALSDRSLHSNFFFNMTVLLSVVILAFLGHSSGIQCIRAIALELCSPKMFM